MRNWPVAREGRPDSRSEPRAVLAIEQGMMGEMFGLIFDTLAIAFAGLGVAGAIVRVVVWQRLKAAKPAPSIEPGARRVSLRQEPAATNDRMSHGRTACKETARPRWRPRIVFGRASKTA
jgi:hypothetical protein